MKAVSFLLLIAITGCSSIPATRYAGELGQALDSASTLIAINAGFTEANPIVANNMWLLAVKPLLGTVTKYLSPEVCYPTNRIVAHGGSALGFHNLALLAVPAGAAVAVGVASIFVLWGWVDRSAIKACST